MTGLETRRYAMLVRVRDFGEAHRGLFRKSSEGGQAFAAVAAAVEKLGAHGRSKISSARERQRAKGAARQALLERFDTIGRTARAIGEITPGFDDPFRVPRRQNDEALLMTAQVFVDDAKERRDRFVRHGLSDTFVADLQQLVDQCAQAVHSCAAAKATRGVAQKGIGAAFLSGLAAVRQLDVIVPNQLSRDEEAIHGWEAARHIDYPSRRKAAYKAHGHVEAGEAGRAGGPGAGKVTPDEPEAGAAKEGQPKSDLGKPSEVAEPVGVGS